MVDHTDSELRKNHLLVWQCFDCDEFWQTGWDIDMPPRPEIVEHCKIYEKQIKAYLKKYKD